MCAPSVESAQPQPHPHHCTHPHSLTTNIHALMASPSAQTRACGTSKNLQPHPKCRCMQFINMQKEGSGVCDNNNAQNGCPMSQWQHTEGSKRWQCTEGSERRRRMKDALRWWANSQKATSCSICIAIKCVFSPKMHYIKTGVTPYACNSCNQYIGCGKMRAKQKQTKKH